MTRDRSGAGINIDRRSFVTTLAVAGLVPGLANQARAAPAPLGSLFGAGVASGDPSSDGFVLWTRLVGDPLDPLGYKRLPSRVALRYEIATDENMRQLVRRGHAVADGAFGHAVHVEVEGMPSGRPYWYQFIAGGETSVVGTTRTLPDAWARPDRLRLGIASCAHYERGWFSAYRHLAAEQPDLVLFLGDYIYEYNLDAAHAGDKVRSYGGTNATDLQSYRHRYAVHRADPDLQAAHAAAPWIPIWDDHEVEDDYSSIWSSHPEEGRARFRARRAAAYRAWWENMPVRRTTKPKGDSAHIYRRFQYGDLAKIDALDGRQYRSRQPCPDKAPFGQGHMEWATCADLADPTRSLLGHQQERWLYDGFRDRSALWTLIAQDLMVAPLRAKSSQGDRYWSDTWDGYQAARDRLLVALADLQPANPVIFSGDYHSFFVSDLHRQPLDPASELVASEILGTSVTSNGAPYEAVKAVLPDNPHVKFFDSRSRGYFMVDLDRERLTADLRAISDRRDPEATVSTLARFAIEAGRKGLIRA